MNAFFFFLRPGIYVLDFVGLIIYTMRSEIALQYLLNLGLPEESWSIGQSYSLNLLGVGGRKPNDTDVFVRGSVWNELKEKFPPTLKQNEKGKHPRKFEVIEPVKGIEIFPCINPFDGQTAPGEQDIIDSSIPVYVPEVNRVIPVVHPLVTVEIKKELLRPKDLADLAFLAPYESYLRSFTIPNRGNAYLRRAQSYIPFNRHLPSTRKQNSVTPLELVSYAAVA